MVTNDSNKNVLDLASGIVTLRNRRVLLDSMLAALYGVETRRLNEQVRRNRHRFPNDFIVDVTRAELENLMSQNAISSWGGRRKLPFAFTEHGAIMAATILNTPQAVQMSVYVVRAFVRLRGLIESSQELANKLAALERSLLSLDIHTRKQFRDVYEVIRALTQKPPNEPGRPIGFTADLND